MNRRKFLSGMMTLPAMPLLLQSCEWEPSELPFQIKLHTDKCRGHKVLARNDEPYEKELKVETLIVGGGVAGLSAAVHLPHRDFLLCELSDRLGGTSAAVQYGGLQLAQGAHYDLEYPGYYGEKVLQLLDGIEVIDYQPWKDSWGFKERQFVIPHEIKNRCFDHGAFREDVLKEGEEKEQFFGVLAPYLGKMTMPTREIDPNLHHLDQMTFLEFLREKTKLSDSFVRGLDYHMLDDWGGKASQVSALAGIHYFQCRPYYSEINQLFSPPEGNAYFVNKMAKSLPGDQLRLSSLVSRLERQGEKWIAHVVDVASNTAIKVISKNVIYAGQKHALKYVLPKYHPLFAGNQYAPWLVMNFVMKEPFQDFGYWQNEMIVEDETFLGFINSSSQHQHLAEKQVLTAYYCLPPTSRQYLANIAKNQKVIVKKTLTYLEQYFGVSIGDRLETVFLNAMGHAMPIPYPGHLFKNQNLKSKADGLTFAGVDHHRLPLLFEAIDSGIQAVDELYERVT